MKLKYIVAFIVVLFAWGCSTNKNTWLSRNYHGLTAHFNVYFNGNESFKSGDQTVWESNQDDYSTLLVMYPVSKDENISGITGDMDRAIEKGLKLVQNHSITAKPKNKKKNKSDAYKKYLSRSEYNDWVDDAFMLIGKAELYKHEYYEAINTFNYIQRQFTYSNIKYQAIIWKARAYTGLGQYSDARVTLESYDTEGNAPYRYYGEFMAAYADLFLSQKMKEEAIPYLEKAVEATHKKKIKLRYQYILAQLYHQTGRYFDASLAYDKVVRMSPDYEMEFNAKVNKASILYEGASLSEIRKSIEKLLKDKKNTEYQDRIYYALAKLYQMDNNEVEAVDNYILSSQKSIDNEHQKGMSYYELGEIFFKKKFYQEAYVYYDSAAISLNQNFEQKPLVEERRDNLKRIVDNLIEVEYQDSLQMVASMSVVDRNIFIDKIIADLKAEEERLKKLEEEAQFNNDPFMSDNYRMNQTGFDGRSGQWYFYNTSSVASGKSEFEKRWGKRKLEDNWRRKNKEVVAANEPDDRNIFGEDGTAMFSDESIEAVEVKEKPTNKYSKETYLVDLPLTDSALTVSNSKIEYALLSLGVDYRDLLEDYEASAHAYLELIRRYPNSKNRAESLFGTYQSYDLSGQQQDKDRVTSTIIKEYPNSIFAKYLSDPDFFGKLEAKTKLVDSIYQECYASYLRSNYEDVFDKYQMAIALDEQNVLMPKYRLLKSLAFAKTGNGLQFQGELEALVSRHPDTEESELALNWLEEIANGRMPVKGAVNQGLIARRNEDAFGDENVVNTGEVFDESFEGGFVKNSNDVFSLIILPNQEADFNVITFNLADFNFSRFLMNDYELGTLNLPDGSKMLQVNGFRNDKEAMDYFYIIRQHPELFATGSGGATKVFVVSSLNLKQLLSAGDLNAFTSFFIENYLNGSEGGVNIDSLSEEELERLEEEKNKLQYLNENGEHYVILLVSNKKVSSSSFRSALSSFSRRSVGSSIKVFKKEDVDIFNVYSVQMFDGRESAMDFIQKVEANNVLLKDVKQGEYYIWAIGKENIELLFQSKDWKLYKEHYSQTYK